MRIRHCIPLCVSLLVVAVISSSGFAQTRFDSYPTWSPIHLSPHDQITQTAARCWRFNEEMTQRLMYEVRQVDWNESSWSPSFWHPFDLARTVPNAQYQARHHFDRGPGRSHAQAFKDGAAYVREQKLLAVNEAFQGRMEQALTALGHALHALQDLKAHSNFVDLTRQEQDEVERALVDPTWMPPARLKITSFSPGAEDAERPRRTDPGWTEDDPYSHGDFAKDSPDKNEEAKAKIGTATKYELAREAAIQESKDFLYMFRCMLNARIWELFRRALPPVDPFYFIPSYEWAAIENCGTDGCLVSRDEATAFVPSDALNGEETVMILGVPLHFFFTPDQARAADGAAMVLVRELRTSTNLYGSPISLELRFHPDDLLGFEPSSLGVYSATLSGWKREPGAQVDLVRGVATLDVLHPGVYALGGRGLHETQ